MDTTPLTALHSNFGRPKGKAFPLARSFAWLAGLAAAAAAFAIAAVLAVFAAAAVTVIAVISAMVVMLTGLALRARRAADHRGATVLEARRVGHAWVAYGWDRTVR